MIEREYGLNKRPAVLLNCPYRDEEPIDTDDVHHPARVLYQGKVQTFRGIEQLILAFHHIDGAELTISGDGPLLDRFRHLAVSEGLLDRVRFSGRYEPEETLSLVRQHDIGVLPFSPATLSITYSSPNKLFDYAMGGLAIASTDLPYMRMVIEKHRMGVLFPTNAPSCIAGTLQSLIKETGRLAEYRRNSRKAALEHFSWEQQFAANYPFL
jgi:glycosyltransferase involved in cell wall biosynthesis